MPDSNVDKTHERNASSGAKEVNQLIVDAVLQLTDVIETMHSRISPLSWVTPSHQEGRTAGITGMVYNNIRRITEMVGKRSHVPLNILANTLNQRTDSASHGALLSALNGVIGDHLHTNQSPLAIPMSFRQRGEGVDMRALVNEIAESNGKVVIMVHGLCMNDRQWEQDAHDHGHHIAKDLGHTTVYLHYNTGRHIFENGQQFSELLNQLVTQFALLKSTHTLDMSIVAHSMGGLVTRSAHHHSAMHNAHWPQHLQKIIFLGTPHHGAPLEQAGNWVDLFLGMHHFTAPLARITQIRSAGIADLRHGYIAHSDTHSPRRFDYPADQRDAIPLPTNVECFAIAATMSDKSNLVSEQLIGDGLVPLNSALGKHDSPQHLLQFKPENQWVGQNIGHVALLGNKDVYKVIHNWLK